MFGFFHSICLTLKWLYFLQDNYDHFDGFVILHGTDTMAYTASALSFMLEDLGKPVILTGSQVRHNCTTSRSFSPRDFPLFP